MRWVIGLCLVALVAGCGTQVAQTDETSTRGGRPPITLLTGPHVDVNSGLGCWDHGCADGVATATKDLHAVTGSRVDFRFLADGSTFVASLSPLPARGCHRSYEATVKDEGNGTFSLTPLAPVGRYRVGLDGEAERGQVFGEFVWTTTEGHTPAPPTAEVSVVWAPHGKIEGGVFHLSVGGLPRSPRDAAATITATAANGHTYTFDAGRPEIACPRQGRVTFYETGPGRGSRRVAHLGPAPFTYDVTLMMDGTTYRASAVWPDDHVDDPIYDNTEQVPLVFDPPLPQAE